MAKAPLTRKDLVRFRDQADSHQYNDHVKETFYDIVDLYNFANREEKELKAIREFFEVGSHFFKEQLDQMKSEINSLHHQLEALQKSGQEYTRFVPVTEFKPDSNVEDYEKASIDKQHDIVTLSTWGYSTSKLYIYDDLNDEYIVPNTIQYEITPKEDGVLVEENDFSDAIVPDQFKFWHRKCTYLSGLHDYVDCQIVIKLPNNIISNKDINSIYLHPFPLNSMDILNVEYQLDGAWKPLPGFKTIEKAGNEKFCFGSIEMNAIRISLRQRHPVRKGNKDVFHFGLRQLGVDYNDYQSEVGRFTIPVEFHDTFMSRDIYDIRPVYRNAESLSIHQEGVRLSTFRLYGVDDQDQLKYLSDAFPVLGDLSGIQVKDKKILIKGMISLDRNTGATPALTGVEIVYKGDS